MQMKAPEPRYSPHCSATVRIRSSQGNFGGLSEPKSGFGSPKRGGGEPEEIGGKNTRNYTRKRGRQQRRTGAHLDDFLVRAEREGGERRYSSGAGLSSPITVPRGGSTGFGRSEAEAPRSRTKVRLLFSHFVLVSAARLVEIKAAARLLSLGRRLRVASLECGPARELQSRLRSRGAFRASRKNKVYAKAAKMIGVFFLTTSRRCEYNL